MSPLHLPELILHILSLLPPHPHPESTPTLLALSSLSHSHRLLLLPYIFSALILRPSSHPNALSHRIHTLSALTASRPELCALVRHADIDLGTGSSLRYDDLIEISRLLSRLTRLRTLRVVETWGAGGGDVGRMAGRGRLYGCWVEACLPAVGKGWGAEVREVEVVGVTGDEGRVLKFVGSLGGGMGEEVMKKKVALVRLVRVKGTPFSTGELAVVYEQSKGGVGRPMGGGERGDEGGEDTDPTETLAGFLRSLEGTQTREVGLALPLVRSTLDHAREGAGDEGREDLTVEWVEELGEALRRYAPKVGKLDIRSSLHEGPLVVSPEVEAALRNLKGRLPFFDMESPL